MKAQLALGRSWPLASHLPGAPASGLTENIIQQDQLKLGFFSWKENGYLT